MCRGIGPAELWKKNCRDAAPRSSQCVAERRQSEGWGLPAAVRGVRARQIATGAATSYMLQLVRTAQKSNVVMDRMMNTMYGGRQNLSVELYRGEYGYMRI